MAQTLASRANGTSDPRGRRPSGGFSGASSGAGRPEPFRPAVLRQRAQGLAVALPERADGLGWGPVLADEHTKAATASLMGHLVEVQVKSGEVYKGIFEGANDEYAVMLRMARLIRISNRDKAAMVDPVAAPQGSLVKEAARKLPVAVLQIPAAEFVQVIGKDIPIAAEGGNGLLPSGAGELATDGEVSRRRSSTEGRELEPWLPDAGDDVAHLRLEKTFSAYHGRTWDQFAANRELFGVETSFDEELYTTRLERGSDAMSVQREREAARIAREIEQAQTRNVHQLEERGQRLPPEIARLDEEARFSSVLRPEDTSDTGHLEDEHDTEIDEHNDETFGSEPETELAPARPEQLPMHPEFAASRPILGPAVGVELGGAWGAPAPIVDPVRARLQNLDRGRGHAKSAHGSPYQSPARGRVVPLSSSTAAAADASLQALNLHPSVAEQAFRNVQHEANQEGVEVVASKDQRDAHTKELKSFAQTLSSRLERNDSASTASSAKPRPTSSLSPGGPPAPTALFPPSVSPSPPTTKVATPLPVPLSASFPPLPTLATAPPSDSNPRPSSKLPTRVTSPPSASVPRLGPGPRPDLRAGPGVPTNARPVSHVRVITTPPKTHQPPVQHPTRAMPAVRAPGPGSAPIAAVSPAPVPAATPGTGFVGPANPHLATTFATSTPPLAPGPATRAASPLSITTPLSAPALVPATTSATPLPASIPAPPASHRLPGATSVPVVEGEAAPAVGAAAGAPTAAVALPAAAAATGGGIASAPAAAGAGTVPSVVPASKFKLNPNAKEFKLNPNAKVFTPGAGAAAAVGMPPSSGGGGAAPPFNAGRPSTPLRPPMAGGGPGAGPGAAAGVPAGMFVQQGLPVSGPGVVGPGPFMPGAQYNQFPSMHPGGGFVSPGGFVTGGMPQVMGAMQQGMKMPPQPQQLLPGHFMQPAGIRFPPQNVQGMPMQPPGQFVFPPGHQWVYGPNGQLMFIAPMVGPGQPLPMQPPPGPGQILGPGQGPPGMGPPPPQSPPQLQQEPPLQASPGHLPHKGRGF